MASGSSIYTLYPGFRMPGYFTDDNVALLSNMITKTLAKEYKQKIIVTDASIMRRMVQIHEERIETVPQMNRRVALDLLREVRNQYDETERANYLLSNQWNSYNYDVSLGILPYVPIKMKTDAINPSRVKYRAPRLHFTY